MGEHGATATRLETNRNLPEALELYRLAGYVEVAPFNDEPYAHHWFQKESSVAPERGSPACPTSSSASGR